MFVNWLNKAVRLADSLPTTVSLEDQLFGVPLDSLLLRMFSFSPTPWCIHGVFIKSVRGVGWQVARPSLTT